MDIHIEGQNLEVLPEWRDKIKEELDRLQAHYLSPIQHARIEIIGTRHHHLGAFEVRVVIIVAGETITIKRQGELVSPVLGEAFKALDQTLREYARIRQKKVKVHEESTRRGTVLRLFPMEDYGFIETSDGLEVYFHANALKKGKLEKLKPGHEVKFVIEEGEKGPQAVWVQPIDRS